MSIKKILSTLFGGFMQTHSNKMNIQEILKTGNYHLIDVREPEELIVQGEIKNANNIPLGELENRKNEIKNLKGEVIFFCRSGMRSGKAVELFKKEGMTNIHNGGSYENLSQLL